jgi:hypothetical protein
MSGSRKKGNTLGFPHWPPDAESPAAKPLVDRRPEAGQGAVEKERRRPAKLTWALSSARSWKTRRTRWVDYVPFVRSGPKLQVQGRDSDRGHRLPARRFRVKPDQTLEPMSDRDFAKQLRGKPVKELRDQAARAAGKKPGGS